MNRSVFLLFSLFIAGFPGHASASDSAYPNACFPPYSVEEKSSNQLAGIVAEEAPVIVCNVSDDQLLNAEIYQQSLYRNPDRFQSQGYRSTDLPSAKKPGIRWNPLLAQMLLFTTIENGLRMTEEKTRDKLSGPFFRDWMKSVSMLGGWDDRGKFFTNYVAHPMQGATAAFIYKNNDTRYNTLTFDAKDKRYWNMTGLALVFATVHGLQFEIGPYSEASLGNVGQAKEIGYSKMAWLDIVVTPTLGTGWAVGEDALDRYLIQWIESRSSHRAVYIPARILLNPIRSFSNVLRLKSPFYRDDRR